MARGWVASFRACYAALKSIGSRALTQIRIESKTQIGFHTISKEERPPTSLRANGPSGNTDNKSLGPLWLKHTNNLAWDRPLFLLSFPRWAFVCLSFVLLHHHSQSCVLSCIIDFPPPLKIMRFFQQQQRKKGERWLVYHVASAFLISDR